MQKLFQVQIYGFLVKDDQLLLIKQKEGLYQDMLNLPGGVPEHGESIEDTLHRVVHESTGIEILEPGMVLGNYVHTVTAQDNKSIVQVYSLVYILDEFDDSALAKNKNYKDAINWYSLEDLQDKNISPLVAGALATLTGAGQDYEIECDEEECEIEIDDEM